MNKEIDYHIEETDSRITRTYVYESGMVFRETRSKIVIMGLPLVHITRGICPETGRRITARGIIAVGRISIGVIAIGQAAFGAVALGQAAIGLLFFGQLGAGVAGIGQAAIAILAGIGQLATGYVAVGQFAVGYYALGQVGMGTHVVSMARRDPEAIRFFTGLREWIRTAFTF